MRTLTWYTSWEFLKVFVLALAGMTAFMLLVGIAREAVREGLGPGPILRLLPFIVPDSMRFSVPASALLAACTSFGRMSGENEVVAIKSLGISPAVLLVPVIVMGFVISVFAVWVNDLAVSWGRAGMGRVISESIEQIAYGMLRTQRSFSTDRVSIAVERVDGRRLIMPVLTFHGDEETTGYTVSAREAELRRNPGQESLSILIQDGSMWGPGGVEGGFPGTEKRVIKLQALGRNGKSSPSDIPLHAIPKATTHQGQQIRRLEYGMAAEAAFQLMAGNLPGLAGETWQERQKCLRQERYRLNRLRTEPWRRWSNGFSCFFFVLVGAPWAIRRRNSDFVTVFFLCFLPILLIYYPLMAYGVDRAKEGALPQYAVWIGNATCAVIAAWLLKRVLRY